MNEAETQKVTQKTAQAILDSPALSLAYQPIAGTPAGAEFAQAIQTLLDREAAQAQVRVRGLEAELDEFMRYHEEEVSRMFEISRDHGTAVVMFRVDRMQFMHLPAAELEARVKMVAVQTLEALLAGTPARETFDRLVRAWVQERMQKGGGA